MLTYLIKTDGMLLCDLGYNTNENIEMAYNMVLQLLGAKIVGTLRTGGKPSSDFTFEVKTHTTLSIQRINNMFLKCFADKIKELNITRSAVTSLEIISKDSPSLKFKCRMKYNWKRRLKEELNRSAINVGVVSEIILEELHKINSDRKFDVDVREYLSDLTISIIGNMADIDMSKVLRDVGLGQDKVEYVKF